MNKKKWLGFIDKRPLIWLHYVLLLGILFGAYFLGDFLFGSLFNNLWVMGIWFFVFLSIGDQAIHFILGVD